MTRYRRTRTQLNGPVSTLMVLLYGSLGFALALTAVSLLFPFLERKPISEGEVAQVVLAVCALVCCLFEIGAVAGVVAKRIRDSARARIWLGRIGGCTAFATAFSMGYLFACFRYGVRDALMLVCVAGVSVGSLALVFIGTVLGQPETPPQPKRGRPERRALTRMGLWLCLRLESIAEAGGPRARVARRLREIMRRLVRPPGRCHSPEDGKRWSP